MPLELGMALEFVKKQRGKPKLKLESYLYCLLREKHGLKTWRCDKRQCKAIATTFETTKEHLHKPDMKHLEQLKVLEKMKVRAANSNEQPTNFLHDTTATITPDCAVPSPKLKSLARSIQRQRGWRRQWKMWLFHRSCNWHWEERTFQVTTLVLMIGKDFQFLAPSKTSISWKALPNGTQTEHLNAGQLCFYHPAIAKTCSICERTTASLKTALQEYAHEKFCQWMPKRSITSSVFCKFSTITKILIS